MRIDCGLEHGFGYRYCLNMGMDLSIDERRCGLPAGFVTILLSRSVIMGQDNCVVSGTARWMKTGKYVRRHSSPVESSQVESS